MSDTGELNRLNHRLSLECWLAGASSLPAGLADRQIFDGKSQSYVQSSTVGLFSLDLGGTTRGRGMQGDDRVLSPVDVNRIFHVR